MLHLHSTAWHNPHQLLIQMQMAYGDGSEPPASAHRTPAGRFSTSHTHLSVFRATHLERSSSSRTRFPKYRSSAAKQHERNLKLAFDDK
jgi:hypothetical protein